MSADNWAQCPRCIHTAATTYETEAAKIPSLYGTVSVEEFDKRRARVEELRVAKDDVAHTFREDYEFYGAARGTVKAVYAGRCTECGLSLKFTHEEVLYDV